MCFWMDLMTALDNIRSDVLQMKPFPTVEQAYAHVRREALRQAVMTDNSNELSGAVLASKGLKLHSSKILSQSKHKEPSNGKCSHCGGNKHTSETCFKLHGYPDWWTDFQARKRRDTTDSNPGKAAVATVEPHLSLIPKSSSHTTKGNVLICSNHDDDSNAWILDSGATDHMTFDAADFSERSIPRRSSIANANGGLSAVTGTGTVMLSPALSLSNTLLVPSLSHKLLSVSQVTKALNCVVLIYPFFCFLQDILTKEIIGRGTKRGGLYYMEDFSVGRAHHMHYPRNNKMEQVLLWHRRLGHPSFGYLKHVSLIHSDVWGPSPKSSISGYRWFVIFVDDCTRMTWIYLLKQKNEVIHIFQQFHKMIQTQYSKKIKILRSDNGGEFVNHKFHEYFKKHGLIHETTCPQTPQQNGVAERKNRHILETARALLHGAHVPHHHWTDAVTTAVYLINRKP